MKMILNILHREDVSDHFYFVCFEAHDIRYTYSYRSVTSVFARSRSII